MEGIYKRKKEKKKKEKKERRKRESRYYYKQALLELYEITCCLNSIESCISV